MAVMYHCTCRIDEINAGLYMHYCETHDILYNATYEDNHVYIEICGEADDIQRFKRWILKALYNQEAQHG